MELFTTAVQLILQGKHNIAHVLRQGLVSGPSLTLPMLSVRARCMESSTSCFARVGATNTFMADVQCGMGLCQNPPPKLGGHCHNSPFRLCRLFRRPSCGVALETIHNYCCPSRQHKHRDSAAHVPRDIQLLINATNKLLPPVSLSHTLKNESYWERPQASVGRSSYLGLNCDNGCSN